MEGHKAIHKFWNQLISTFECDPTSVQRQSVELRPVSTGESFEAIQGPLLLEDLGITLQRMGSIENSSATAGGFLGFTGVRRRIGPKKKS